MKLYVKAATDNSDKWVIVNKEVDKHRPDDMNQLFIGPQKYNDWYSPSFTSTRRRNYDRAKLFNSKEEAEAYIEKQNKEKELFITIDLGFGPNARSTKRPMNIEILPYSDAIAAIGDPEQNYKNYKQKQADDRKKSNAAYRERYKKEHANDNVKDPGKYKVRFWYSNSWLGEETFTVDAESINDAFKKAKAKALRQDPYRDTQGYDQKMTFNKNEIWKIK